jgi:hypothetical protein
VRRLRPEQKVGIEVYDRVGGTSAIDAHGDSSVRAFTQIPVHSQRRRDVRLFSEKHLAHRHRLQRLLGNLAQHGSCVEPYLRPLSDGEAGIRW